MEQGNEGEDPMTIGVGEPGLELAMESDGEMIMDLVIPTERSKSVHGVCGVVTMEGMADEE